MRRFVSLILAGVSAVACKTAYEQAPDQVGAAHIINSGGQAIGVAHLYSIGGDLTINLAIHGLVAGIYRVELKAGAECDLSSPSEAKFPPTSATSIPKPIPALTVAQNGTGTVSSLLAGSGQYSGTRRFDPAGNVLLLRGQNGAGVACGVFAGN